MSSKSKLDLLKKYGNASAGGGDDGKKKRRKKRPRSQAPAAGARGGGIHDADLDYIPAQKQVDNPWLVSRVRARQKRERTQLPTYTHARR